ncbi:MAG: hypothetical protein K2M95_07725 [Clostridiales bacterium]|nr:hypothetical protein [Clostridiales bacterium]
MAKDDAPLKKKRHGCRNCLITTLILIVIFNVGVYFTGNYFTKKYFSVSLMDCFKVMYDLTHSNKKKIVTNGYSDADYVAFEKELKKELFIKEDARFSLSELMNELFASEEGESGEKYVLQPAQGDGLFYFAPERAASVNTDAFIEKLSEIFSRDNMDLERLRAYDESRHEDYVLHVSDRMLAAAIGKSVDALGESISKIGNFLNEYSFDSLSSVARVDQITFGQKTGVKDGESATVKTVKVTVSADARGIAQAFLKKNTGKDMKFLTKLVLPKRFYVTAEVPAEANASIDNVLRLNNMNDKQMARTYKVLDGIMRRVSNSDDSESVRDKIENAVNKNVSTALDKASRVFPLSEAQNGKVRLDVFETVIDLTKLNEGEDGALKPAQEQLHSSDLIKTLAGVVASDLTDGIKPEYDFAHQYYDSTEDKVVYLRTAPAEGLTWVDYKQLFMQELEKKYLLDFSRGTVDPSDDITFDDLMKFFGLGEPNGEAKDLELSELLDGRKLHG